MSKIILTHEVTGLGDAGDIVDVKTGYARNYLLPQGLAVSWTRGGEKQVEQIRAARVAREHASIEDAQAAKTKLESSKVVLKVKSGKEGRLFGSVKTADIATAVSAAGLGEIDKRKVRLAEPIKALGEHQAQITLLEDVTATITLQVVAAK